jgi:hypothetical protein
MLKLFDGQPMLIKLNMNYPIHKKEADEHPVVSFFFFCLIVVKQRV